MALLVNEVLWIIERSEHEIIPARSIFPGLGHIRGAVKVEEEIVLLHDFETERFPAVTQDLEMVQV
jgi:chemotaxis signal transduction protein